MNSHEYRCEWNWYLKSQISLFTWSCHNCLVIVTSSGIDCEVISRMKTERVRHSNDVERSIFWLSFMDYLCHVRSKMMYVLEWWSVSVLTRVLFWYLFPLLLRNSGNKHQNNPLVSAETLRHSSTYIILYMMLHGCYNPCINCSCWDIKVADKHMAWGRKSTCTICSILLLDAKHTQMTPGCHNGKIRYCIQAWLLYSMQLLQTTHNDNPPYTRYFRLCIFYGKQTWPIVPLYIWFIQSWDVSTRAM